MAAATLSRGTPNFRPTLQSIQPASATERDQGWIEVRGSNFMPLGATVAFFEPRDASDSATTGPKIWVDSVVFLDSTRCKFRVPAPIDAGLYRVGVCNIYNQQFARRCRILAPGYRVYATYTAPFTLLPRSAAPT